jgi:hypothetical protein
MKTDKLRDDPYLDISTRVLLWKETVHVRRKRIRDRSTVEILIEFPGYTDPVLVEIFVAYLFLFELN